MSERRVFEIPEELRACGVERYATVLGNRWEWYSSLYGAEHETPLWSLNRPATTLLMNERIRQWLLGQLEAPAKEKTGITFEDVVAHMKDREMNKHLKRLQDRAMQVVAIPPGVWEKDTLEEEEAKPPAKNHVWIELPLERVIHNCPMAPCEMTAARTLAWAEEWRRKEAALREFKRNRREWPTCCGDECEVEYDIGDASVVVRCKHD